MERVLLVDGVKNVEGKRTFKGLFGEDLVIVDDIEQESLSVAVVTKLTKSENDELERWALKCGISKSKLMRDCIRQQLQDLQMLSEP
jgi:hypothetical protein